MNNSATAFSDQLAMLGSNVILQEIIWKQFGFNKIPKRGLFFDKFINKEDLNREYTFQREIFLVTIAYGFNHLEKLDSEEHTLKIFYKIMEKYIDVNEMYRSFHFKDNQEMYSFFSEGFKEYYRAYFKNNHETMSTRLFRNKNHTAAWLLGTIELGTSKNLKIFIENNLEQFQTKLIDDIELKYF